MARVYIKVTAWERYEIDDSKAEEVKAKLESGEITTGNDIAEMFDIGMEIVDDASTDMTLEDNGGYSTIELMLDDNTMIWQNGKED